MEHVKTLFYYRCEHCLTPVTVPGKTPPAGCDCGGASFEYLGRVSGPRYVTESELCACDDRCTFASGPNCSCQCRGRNHGAGMLAYEKKTQDGGAVVFFARVDEKARAGADYYREGLADWESRAWFGIYLDAHKKSARGEWIASALYEKVHELCFLYRKFKKAKTHKARFNLREKARAVAYPAGEYRSA